MEFFRCIMFCIISNDSMNFKSNNFLNLNLDLLLLLNGKRKLHKNSLLKVLNFETLVNLTSHLIAK